MGHCGCKNGMKKGRSCNCSTCTGQRSKTYSRRIDGNTFIGSKIPVQRNIANALANKIRNNGNNARVIPAKNGYRVYVNPNRRYNHPVKMMQVVPNVFSRDRNQNGIYDSVEKLLMPKKPRTYDRGVGVVRNQDIVALGLQAPGLNFDPDRTKDMIESRFGKAVADDWIRRYGKGDGESVLDGRLADNRLLMDNLKNGGNVEDNDSPDMFYQLTSLASKSEEEQIQKMNELYGNTSKLYKELGAVDYDIDFEESTIRYIVENEFGRTGEEREIELTFDELLLNHDPSKMFMLSDHVESMVDTPYNQYDLGLTTSLLEATQYYQDDLQAMTRDDYFDGKTKIEKIEQWLQAEIKDYEYGYEDGMFGVKTVEDGRGEMAERLQDQITRKFLKDRVQRSDENKLRYIKNWLNTEIDENEPTDNLDTKTDFQYGIAEAAKELLAQIEQWERQEQWVDEAINDEYQSLPNNDTGLYTLEQTLREELDNISYWSLIRSAYMNRLRDYDKKMDFKPHMMYNPKTGEGKLAETYEDHLRWKEQGWTHTGYARRISDADRYTRPQKYLGITYYIDPSSGMVELPADTMQNVPSMMFDNERQVRDYIMKLKSMRMPNRMRGIKRGYNSHGGGDLPTMAIANTDNPKAASKDLTFIPLFKNSPPKKNDEMYYTYKNGIPVGKRKYVKQKLQGDDWYGYYVDSLGRRVE